MKGILKNPQCSSLPRPPGHQHCSCSYLGEALPEPPDDPPPPPLPGPPPLLRTLSQLSHVSHVSRDQVETVANGGDIIYYSSANISTCDASEKLSQNEVLDTVESSV